MKRATEGNHWILMWMRLKWWTYLLKFQNQHCEITITMKANTNFQFMWKGQPKGNPVWLKQNRATQGQPRATQSSTLLLTQQTKDSMSSQTVSITRKFNVVTNKFSLRKMLWYWRFMFSSECFSLVYPHFPLQRVGCPRMSDMICSLPLVNVGCPKVALGLPSIAFNSCRVAPF